MQMDSKKNRMLCSTQSSSVGSHISCQHGQGQCNSNSLGDISHIGSISDYSHNNNYHNSNNNNNSNSISDIIFNKNTIHDYPHNNNNNSTKHISQTYKNQIRKKQKQKLLSQIRQKLYIHQYESTQQNHELTCKTRAIWRQFVSSVASKMDMGNNDDDAGSGIGELIVPVQLIQYFEYLEIEIIVQCQHIINTFLRADNLYNVIFVTLFVQTYEGQTSNFLLRTVHYLQSYHTQQPKPEQDPQTQTTKTKTKPCITASTATKYSKTVSQIQEDLDLQFRQLMHSNLTELASYEEVYIDYFVKFMQKLNWQHNGGGGGGFLDTECLGVIKGFFVGYWDKYVECAETHVEGKLVNNGSSNTTNNENYHNYDNHQHISNYNHNQIYILPNFLPKQPPPPSSSSNTSPPHSIRINFRLCAQMAQRLLTLKQCIPNIDSLIYSIITVLIKHDRSRQAYYLVKVALNCLESHVAKIVLDPYFSQFVYGGFTVETVKVNLQIIEKIVNRSQLVGLWQVDFGKLLEIMYGMYELVCQGYAKADLKLSNCKYVQMSNSKDTIDKYVYENANKNKATYRKIQQYILNSLYNFAFSQIAQAQHFFQGIDYEKMFIKTFCLPRQEQNNQIDLNSHSFQVNVDRNDSGLMFQFLDFCIAVLWNYPSTKMFNKIINGTHLQLIQLSCQHILQPKPCNTNHTTTTKKTKKTWQFTRDLCQTVQLCIQSNVMIHALALKIQKIISKLQRIVLQCQQEGQWITNQFQSILSEYQQMLDKCREICQRD